ncbi:MAG: pyridoxal kinase [Gammaproteobacteria bacterium]|nr:pyridoxal kinase [Gammaproteobacteria bacterium]
MSERGPRQKPVIVSIQSQLVFGCAGNNAAVPLLQGLGATVYAVPTVLLSNTPHYPTIGGKPLEAPFVAELLERLLDRLEAGAIDGILTGYFGSADAVHEAARFIDRVRERNPAVSVLCDPVIGDLDIGRFVPEDVAGAIVDELVPRADMLTPNLFEAQWLTGLKRSTPHELMDGLLTGRTSIASLTGIGLADKTGETVSTLAFDKTGIRRVRTPRLNARPTGTGDLFSAAFLYYRLIGADLGTTLSLAVDSVFSLMENLLENGLHEIDVLPGVPQTAIKNPRFGAETLQDAQLAGLFNT